MSVFDLRVGQSGIIKSLNIDGAGAERLKALGFVHGARVTALSFSLFNSGVLAAVGYSRVGLRKSVALRIEVEPCD